MSMAKAEAARGAQRSEHRTGEHFGAKREPFTGRERNKLW
jgi:hypothetical protein